MSTQSKNPLSLVAERVCKPLSERLKALMTSKTEKELEVNDELITLQQLYEHEKFMREQAEKDVEFYKQSYKNEKRYTENAEMRCKTYKDMWLEAIDVPELTEMNKRFDEIMADIDNLKKPQDNE